MKTPPRPELPLPPKLPEQPAMVVPHTALQVEMLVHAAIQEIWQGCGLGGGGTMTLTGLPVPKPSERFLGHDAKGQDLEAVAIRSYRRVTTLRAHVRHQGVNQRDSPVRVIALFPGGCM